MSEILFIFNSRQTTKIIFKNENCLLYEIPVFENFINIALSLFHFRLID